MEYDPAAMVIAVLVAVFMGTVLGLPVLWRRFGSKACTAPAPPETPNKSEVEPASHYEVFISHCGDDTKLGFVSHVETQLRRQNVLVFVDNKGLRPGEPAWPKMQASLRGAAIQLMVLFPGYQASWWCMEELRIAMETPQKVKPVFFGVKPGAADEHMLKTALVKMKKVLPHTPDTLLHSWQQLLSGLGGIGGVTGWEHKPKQQSEAELMDKVTADILTALTGKERI